MKVCLHKTYRNGIAHCQSLQFEIVGVLYEAAVDIAVWTYVGNCRIDVAGILCRPTVEDDG